MDEEGNSTSLQVRDAWLVFLRVFLCPLAFPGAESCRISLLWGKAFGSRAFPGFIPPEFQGCPRVCMCARFIIIFTAEQPHCFILRSVRSVM